MIFRKSLKSGDRVTPVCTTEFIAFSNAYPYFQRLNTELLGLSIDSNASHLAWRKLPTKINRSHHLQDIYKILYC